MSRHEFLTPPDKGQHGYRSKRDQELAHKSKMEELFTTIESKWQEKADGLPEPPKEIGLEEGEEPES